MLQARGQLHQVVGALEMIGLPAAARFVHGYETAVQRLAQLPNSFDTEALATLERAGYVVMDYLRRQLAGQDISPLALFPSYQQVMTLAGVQRAHPADLCTVVVNSAEPAALAATAAPLTAGVDARAIMERELLASLRGRNGTAPLQRMSDLCASLAAGAQGRLAEVWHLASAFFEAQACGRLAADDFSRRMASRLLAQLRASERGVTDTPDTLIQDLRFFCARATSDGQGAAPRLSQVRRALSLPELSQLDYAQSPLGRFDPALLPLAKRRVAAFRESWSALSSGDASTAGQVNEQAALVAESVRQLYPDGEQLAQALRAAVASPSRPEGGPRPEVAMEVATALLCVDSSLDEMDLDEPQLGQRVKRLAARLDQVASGKEPAPIEPWMESLYREVSDRQTMGSVVQELRASLAEVEQQLDRFHRQPQDRDPLFMVPGQLASMRGVLSVLGLDHAAQAVQHMRDDVDRIAASPEHQATIDARLADNLGGLSFLIDMLAVQPQLAKSLFRFDAETGSFTALMGRATVATPVASAAMDPTLQASLASVAEEALWGQTTHDDLARSLEGVAQQAMAADAPALAQAVTRAQEALADAHEGADKVAARASIGETIGQIATAQSAALASAAPPAPLVDADMREVFIEEAREVLALARESLQTLSAQPRDLGAMTSLRRTFHTLKGSARMVGLADLGEAAWAYEQLLNARLAEAVIEADAVMREFAARAVADLSAWVDAIALSPQAAWDASALMAEAHVLRDTAGQVSDEARAAPQPPVLTSPVDEDLSEDDVTHYAELDVGPSPAAATPTVLPSSLLALDLDLSHDNDPQPTPTTTPQALDLVSDTQPGALDGEATLAAAETSVAQPATETDASAVDLELDFSVPVAEAPTEPADSAPPEPTPAPAVHVPPTLTLVEPTAASAQEPAPEDDADRFKMVGHLRVPIGLFNVFLNEADEQSRRLCVELAEWSLEHHQPVSETSEALAHSLAGNSATVGYSDLSALARRLEHALEHSRTRGQGSPAEAQLFVDVGDEIRRLLHQFAAGFLRAASPELLQRLEAHEAHEAKLPHAATPAAAPVAPTVALGEMRYAALSDEPEALAPHTPEPTAVHAEPGGLAALSDVLESQDDLDPVLWPVFAEEGEELLPVLAQELRHWEAAPSERAAPVAAMRALHTFKGGARLAGAMALGELAHRLESSFEQVLAHLPASAEGLAALAGGVDRLDEHFQALLARAAGPAPSPVPPSVRAEAALASPTPEAAGAAIEEPAKPAETEAAPITPVTPVLATAQAAPDWSRFLGEEALRGPDPVAGQRAEPSTTVGTVRVRVPLLDRMVSHAGEVSAARARIDSELGQMRQGLKELTENLDRLRRQLRDLEIQAETQMASRMEAARAAQQTFDPLEMDRFTRVQELTRMLAESVNDVGTVQRTLQQSIQVAEDQLAQQARLARDLQDDLLRARMVEFDTLSERLYRVVRQAAKETGKQVRLNLAGGTTEVDRGVLDRMAPAFEHLLRNAVVHGIEATALREATGRAGRHH
ncbi:Hpt domain-containing protein [Ideonella paludis]|uniref:Hpt domain-containing protein n=1 Tax=Ideonella paludis TaxID=1233411 RepID=UPI00363AE6C7